MPNRHIILAAALLVGTVAAADPPLPANAPTVSYAKLDALPDWRGIWTPKGPPFLMGGEKPQFKGAYKTTYDTVQAAIKAGKDTRADIKNDRTTNCKPPGMPGVMFQPYDVEFLFTPGRVTIVQEAYMQVRRIFTDGRAPNPDPDPTYNGYSTGHWEGGTLVARTNAIRPDMMMGTFGATHSDRLVITERLHLAPGDPDTLVDEFIFDDPVALAEPWHQSFSYQRHRDLDQIEYICEDNDRNPVDKAGDTGFVQPK